MADNLKIMLKGASFVFVGYATSKVFAYLYRVLLARLLSPESYGILSIALALLGIATVIASLGLYQGVLHFVSKYSGLKDEQGVRGAILGSQKLQLVFSLLVAITLFAFAGRIAQFFNLSSQQAVSLELVLRIFACMLPLQVINSNLMILTQAFKKIEYKVLLRNIFENIVKIAITFALLFIGFGLVGAAMALYVSSAILLIVSFYVVRKKVYNFLARRRTRYELRKLVGYSYPLLAVGFFTMLMTTVDTLALGVLSTAYKTGIYNVVVPTARLLNFPSFVLLSLFLPVATEQYATGNMGELGKIYEVMTRWVFSLTIPMVLFVVVFSAEILSLLFGQVYSEGALPLSILALGFFIYASTDTVKAMLQPIARTKLILWNTILAGSLNLVLNLYLIPLLGMSGAAIATTASYALWSLLAFLEVYFLTKLNPFGLSYFRPFIAAVCAIAPFIVFPLAISDFAGLLLYSVLFISFYLFLLYLFGGIQAEEFELLGSIKGRFWRNGS